MMRLSASFTMPRAHEEHDQAELRKEMGVNLATHIEKL